LSPDPGRSGLGERLDFRDFEIFYSRCLAILFNAFNGLQVFWPLSERTKPVFIEQHQGVAGLCDYEAHRECAYVAHAGCMADSGRVYPGYKAAGSRPEPATENQSRARSAVAPCYC
jgi:hypothetical protein